MKRDVTISDIDTFRFNVSAIFESFSTLFETDYYSILPSFKAFSVLNAMVVLPIKGQLFLVDGFKRFRYLESVGNTEVTVTCLESSVSLVDVLSMVFYPYREALLGSAVLRAKCLAYALKLGVSRSECVDRLFPVLQIKGNDAVLRQYLKVAALPNDVLKFAHEKGFSLKQCGVLCGYEVSVLTRVLALQDSIQLTASGYLDLLALFSDVVVKCDVSLEDLLSRSDMLAILEGGQSPSEKTVLVKRVLDALAKPMLMTQNEKIAEAVKRVTVDDAFKVSWDRTLENQGLDFWLRVSKVSDLESFRTLFSTPDIDDRLEAVFKLM